MFAMLALFCLTAATSFAQHNWNRKDWDKESLGFGCSFSGQMTKPVLNMARLFSEKKLDKIRKLLFSNVPADQYLATFVLETLESKRELEIAAHDRRRILEIKNSKEIVPFCAGCTVWTEIPLKGLFDQSQEIVSGSADNWFNHYYKVYYKKKKNKGQLD